MISILDGRVAERRQEISDAPALQSVVNDFDYYHRLSKLTKARAQAAAAPRPVPAPANSPLPERPAGKLPKSTSFG